jgi:hypothetical protein
MRSFTLAKELEEATSVLDLARRLGDACTEQESELEAMLGKPRYRQLSKAITERVGASKPATWTALTQEPQELESQLGKELADLLGRADPHYPLDCLAVLRGLCRGVLPVFYEVTEGSIVLDAGTPVPFATRPIPIGRRAGLTPKPETISGDGLLDGYGHRVFEYSAGSHVQVALDFSARAEIDRVASGESGALPRVATIHPHGCGMLKVDTKGDGKFFDAYPKCWDLDSVLELLGRVKDVEIAVLPELSLCRPDALEQALSTDPTKYPSLVIAGSAHTREGRGSPEEVRANEARIYLDGKLVGRHRKCRAYIASQLEGEDLSEPLREALSAEQKTITVLSGEHARLAVVICADLVHEYIPQKLLAAYVNTLAVPCFTPKKGSFNGPIADLASRRQAVCAVVNAPPEEATSPLREAGLVGCEGDDPADRRRVRYYLTEAGETQLNKFYAFGDPKDDPPPAPTDEQTRELLRSAIDRAVRIRREANRLGEAAARLQGVIREAEKVGAYDLALEAMVELAKTVRQNRRPDKQDELRACQEGLIDRLNAIALESAPAYEAEFALPAAAHLKYTLGRSGERRGEDLSTREAHLTAACSLYWQLVRNTSMPASAEWFRRQAWSVISLAGNLRKQTRLERALRLATIAKRSFDSLEDEYGQAQCLFMFGFCLRLLGEFREASACLDRAYQLAEHNSFERARADTLMQMGEVRRCLGWTTSSSKTRTRSTPARPRWEARRGGTRVPSKSRDSWERASQRPDCTP